LHAILWVASILLLPKRSEEEHSRNQIVFAAGGLIAKSLGDSIGKRRALPLFGIETGCPQSDSAAP
jgi:hypothetical protein